MKFYKTFITLCLLGLTASAFAHTGLSLSFPADNAALAESPEAIELEFTEDVNLTKLEVVSKMRGEAVEIEFTPSVTASWNYSVPVPELAMGQYEVNWALIGGDGHQVTGSFGFMVHGADMPMMEHGEMAMPMMEHGNTSMPSNTGNAADQEAHDH